MTKSVITTLLVPLAFYFMETFFNLCYEFQPELVAEHIARAIADGQAGYVCVADGVVLNMVQRSPDYRRTVQGAMFAICDSGWLPLYLRWIYGIHRQQYCGPMIFKDLVQARRWRMIFLGTSQRNLDSLQIELAKWNPDVKDMTFKELPYQSVEDFDYKAIARMIADDEADIIWIALGAPKQDYFMARLLPHLRRGVMIGVGAAFKFYSGVGERRAPHWLTRMHGEFLFRIAQDPRKQLRRCFWIVAMMPSMLWNEWRRKHRKRIRPQKTLNEKPA